MTFYSKRYFKRFLDNHLTPENAHTVYEALEPLGTGEETLFRNCCKLLGITRDEFFGNYDCFAQLAKIDDDYGLTEIAAADKFGEIEYDDPDVPSYGAIKNIVLDKTNLEYIEFHKKLYQATAIDLVESYDEDEFDDYHLLNVVEAIGAFHEKKRNLYGRTAELMHEIQLAMDNYEVRNSLDEMNEPTDKFLDRFNSFYDSLSGYEQGELLTLLGIAKEMADIVEKAGHDCL